MSRFRRARTEDKAELQKFWQSNKGPFETPCEVCGIVWRLTGCQAHHCPPKQMGGTVNVYQADVMNPYHYHAVCHLCHEKYGRLIANIVGCCNRRG